MKNFIIYITIFFYYHNFLEWFFKHPQLRYGGYHLIALLLFYLSYYFNFVSLSYSSFIKKTKNHSIFGFNYFLWKEY